MIGVQDFCGHYDWTFEYIRRTFGEDALEHYWADAIAFDSQRHAYESIRNKGFDGMDEYWGHTLTQEEAGYAITRTDDAFRIDMHECPSKGYLRDHGLEAHADYCAHCMGWIGPVAQRAGFTVDHAHNHRGQCWWDLYRAGTEPDRQRLRKKADGHNVETRPDWPAGEHHRYRACQRVDADENDV